jgi:tripartite-type tricarboxylate transporter receptor subunit TctC
MDFFRGKTITLIHSTKPGTGTDARGRLLASYLGEYTGAMVVVKHEPGADGLEGVNYTYRAKPDGLTMCAIAAGSLIPLGVLGLSHLEYKLEELNYIGYISYPLCYAIWVKPDSLYNSVKDSLDGKVITGFGDASKIVTAIAGSEADGGLLNFYPGLKYAEKGLIKPLLIVGSKRNEALSGIPAITELVPLSKEQRELLAGFEAMPIGTPIFGPPGMPEDRLKFLREVFVKIMNREDFRKEVKEESGVWGGYLSGEEIAEAVEAMIKDRALYQRLYSLVERYLIET